MPYHIEMAESAFNVLSGLSHKDQVEPFKYLQKKLADARILANENMQKELEIYSVDVKAHAEGTNIIASGL
ncbi:hypothetical protein MuYL_2510 [Mucilaginibacter xinganensis]|uniref:Uncharacterized protein n=2 Tax=Mucilaginibacter xinganensis TaxID=1234841 RepID=A0A223NWZ8_9SPHI|nr:hypothetical protein MuYL_2510 [Mucilaginibacter xinganensis]